MTTEEPINEALADHQTKASGWEFQKLMDDLHRMVGLMVTEFKLDIGIPALTVEALSVKRYGHFHRDRNGFGLIGEIALNRRYLTTRPYWMVLGTLFHELLHFHQQVHGKPGKGNFHNREFRAKAKSYGLVIDTKGVTDYEAPPTAFSAFLEKHGIKMPKLPEPPVVPPKGKSKLSLWMCPCGIRVRVGRAEFSATCNLCTGRFELRE